MKEKLVKTGDSLEQRQEKVRSAIDNELTCNHQNCSKLTYTDGNCPEHR